MTSFFSFPQPSSAQNAGSLQYQFQPNQTFRYQLELRHEVKMSGGISQAQASSRRAGQASPTRQALSPGRVGQDLPVTTKIIFQASVWMVEVDSVGVATFEARAERFSVKNTIGSKEITSPVLANDQTVQFRVGSYGFLTGQEVLSGSSGLPWNLFLSHVFPDLTQCRYLGQAVFNSKPCVKIGFDIIAPPSARLEKSRAVQTMDYNQGKGTGLFAAGHLVSSETQGSVDLGYNIFSPERNGNTGKVSVKGTFSSRLFLLP